MSTLPLEKIPYMHWGVISRFNYRGDKPLPVKKWDMLLEHFAYISSVRGERPRGADPLEEVVKGADYAIVVADSSGLADSPFSVEPKARELKGEAFAIVNRYPPMARVVDEELLPKIEERLKGSRLALGICLVAFTRRYAERVEACSPSELLKLLEVTARGLEACWSSAKAKGFSSAPAYVFFNLGERAGGSVRRLHTQVYVDLTQDGYGRALKSVLQAFSGSCPLCEEEHEERLVYSGKHTMLWASRAPRRNLHLRFTVKRHVEDLTKLSGSELRELAELLVKAAKALAAAIGHVEGNIVFYQRPMGHAGSFHFFGEILPYESIGGFELLEHARICRVAPEEAAGRLRRAVQSF